MSDLDKLILFRRELDQLRQEWEIALIGRVDGDAAEIQRKMNAALIDKIRQQDRAIAHMMGEKVEAEMHFGEAVLLPVGGMG